MSKKDEEIKRKLDELEMSVLKEAPQPLSVQEKSTQLRADSTSSTSIKSDLCYFAGLGLIVTGFLMLFQHIRVGTGFFAALGIGSQGFGLILIPLLIGIGWMVYDSKNKLAWLLTAMSCALIFFSVMTSLVMSFPSMTLLSMIMMLLPFAFGGALLLKGLGGPKGVEESLKKEIKEIKKD
ncbi:MAG TPA: hypothetical protein V6D17_12615 [Candidatus Obscuribacterales bacterium]